MYFHYRCGERITLLNDNCTAVRNDGDFDHGIVISAEPLLNDTLFEVKIDRKVASWSGSLEVGVTETDPVNFEFPPCASKLQNGCWIMTGNSILKDGSLLVERYGTDLDKLNQDDRVGLMRTSEGDLIIYINGEPQGVAAEGLPAIVYAIVDLYGKCVQVSITNPVPREHNNDDCLSGSSMLAIDNDILNVTLGGDLSELSLSSNNSLDVRMEMSMGAVEPPIRHDKLRFHERCGSLVKLSNGQRTAERRRPLDEFNNGVVMTHRPLFDSELFEIRIDRLVDKWSGSIEMGITTHNPSTLVFPATMTNMRSGTIMMSGCGILTNGKGTRREYGDFNLDELSEGDRVGMMRKPDGNLHYFINGLDQGVAAQRVPTTVWGVIDLYGMTIKVSIVERDEREEQNLMTRRNTRDQQLAVPEPHPLSDYYDRLTFHTNCGTHAQVINNGRTAHRPNAADDFNNGVVLTSRPIKTGELFEVRLDRVVAKWAGSIEIGVTTHGPTELEFPFTMTNVRSGTWMMTGAGIMHNGTTVLEQYGMNLDRLQVGDRVGVLRKENGLLHFFVNGIDQGTAASNVPEKVYGVIDLYGQAVEASIVEAYDYGSPDTLHSSFSNTTLYSDLRFHHVHGKNVRIVNNGQTALRPRPLAEFNDAIVFSNRPLRDGELFEICLDNMVDRWSGSIELGVTAVRPDDVDLPSTATDLCRDTWMLSGSSVMENGTTIKNNYPCDLDTLSAGVRLGVVRTSDGTLEFYRDGVSQGAACLVPHNNVYAVVDLYGQCAQVSIPCVSPAPTGICAQTECCGRSETSASLQALNNVPPMSEMDLHRFSDCHSKNVSLSEGGRLAVRGREHGGAILYSATTLGQEEMFEVSIYSMQPHLAGTLCIGVTSMPPVANANALPLDYCYVTGNELRWKNKIIQQFTPSLSWLRPGDRVGLYRDGPLKLYINGEEVALNFPTLTSHLYVLVDLRGSCSAVTVTSRKTPLSPVVSVRMQDSLELVLDPDPASETSNDPNSQHSRSEHCQYRFHDNHGRNLELSCEKTVARRVASYNQGIAFVLPALGPATCVEIVVETLDARWQSSLMVGLVWVAPERLNLPVTALGLRNPSYVIANDYISVNGMKISSNYGQRLNSVKVGSVVGIKLTEAGKLQLVIDGIAEEEVVPGVFPIGQRAFAFFDLYGQCQQIRILNNDREDYSSSSPSAVDCEKADLESCEKERSTTGLSLNLASTSNEASAVSYSTVDVANHKPANCPYREDIMKFKKTMLLPSQYFLQDEPVCYCIKCYKTKNQDSDTYKDESIIGWVKFPLKNLYNVQTEKWHTAYCGAKLGAVRKILDKGQPLTKDEAEYCGIGSRVGDDMQVVFHPSLQHCQSAGFPLDGAREARAAFQLLVKPGAYSVARDSADWSTKETGAIVLHSLLFKFFGN